jgi:hypothetical protein
LRTTNQTLTPATTAAGASQRKFRNQEPEPFTLATGIPLSSIGRMSDHASSAGGTVIGLSSGGKNEVCLFSPLIVIY